MDTGTTSGLPLRPEDRQVCVLPFGKLLAPCRFTKYIDAVQGSLKQVDLDYWLVCVYLET